MTLKTKLQNKTALITGSSRGIGRAIALDFAKQGANSVINYVNDEKSASNVVDEISQLGMQAIAVKADVSNENDVKALIENAVSKFGKIDILVNNAGIAIDVPFMERTVAQWNKTLSINLLGTFLCCKYSVPYMPEGGKIINISSTNGLNTVSADCLDYDASKAGIISITKSLAQELAPKILVNCIAPGWVDTDINAGLSAEYVKSESERIGVKRFGRPEEIAKVAIFLASDDASYISGATIVVDGGLNY